MDTPLSATGFDLILLPNITLAFVRDIGRSSYSCFGFLRSGGDSLGISIFTFLLCISTYSGESMVTAVLPESILTFTRLSKVSEINLSRNSGVLASISN